MNIEHRTEPVEHWIVDGKAYRLETEKDLWKEVYFDDIGDIRRYDLENVPPEPKRIQREYWVNVYPKHIGEQCKSKEIADDVREGGCIACVKIVIDCEEGEGL